MTQAPSPLDDQARELGPTWLRLGLGVRARVGVRYPYYPYPYP